MDQTFPAFVNYHGLEPLTFRTIKKNSLKVPSSYANQLETFRLSQAAMDLVLQTQLLKIRQNFLEKSIRIEDFKGIRFSNFLIKESYKVELPCRFFCDL